MRGEPPGIGAVAERSGAGPSRLGFHTERGLNGAERGSSGHRRPIIRRVAFTVVARRVGVGLDEIGDEPAKLPGDHAPHPR